MRHRAAFTLLEIMLAMGIGLIVLNAAFLAFVYAGKFLTRIESVGTKNDVAQSAILWSIAKDGLAGYPVGEAQYRRVGVSRIDDDAMTYLKVTIQTIGGSQAVIGPVSLVLPKGP